MDKAGVGPGEVVIEATGLVRRYGTGAAATVAVGGVDLQLRARELTALVGPSGSGKSTLMHLVAGVDVPSEGSVLFEGKEWSAMSEREAAACRATRIGFVLQHANLIPSLTVRENVAAPLFLAKWSRTKALDRADEMLAEVGIADRAHAWPSQVSGGEAQRAAVARACAGTPRLLVADEPTGALDSAAGAVVLDLFGRMVKETGAAALLITHDRTVAAIADRVIRLADGRIDEEG